MSILLIFAAILIFSGVGFRSAWPADEPRFVEVVRGMLESGQWLFPMRGGEYYPDKPPFFFWTMAAVAQITGDLNLAFLVPSAIAGMVTLFLVFDLGKRLDGAAAGRLAAFLLLITPQFLLHVKTAQIDALLMMWVTLGCYGFIRHFFLGPSWRWYFVAWVDVGLGVITKGVGFLPALILIPIALQGFSMSKSTSPRWEAKAWIGPLLALAVIFLWLIPMLIAVGDSQSPELIAYRDNILFKQTGERFANAWHHNKPWYYFILSVIPPLWFPAALLALVGIPNIRQVIRTNPIIGILLVWVVLVIIFFSFSSGKRAVYILPALPFLCLVLGLVFSKAEIPELFQCLLRLVNIVILALVMCFSLLVLTQVNFAMTAVREFSGVSGSLANIMLAGAVLASAFMLLTWSRGPLIHFSAITGITWLLVSVCAFPIVEPLRTPDSIFEKAQLSILSNDRMGLLQYKEQFLLYAPMELTTFGYLPKLKEQERRAWLWMREGEGRHILVAMDAKLSCFDLAKGVRVGRKFRKEWALLSAASLNSFCDLPEKYIFYVHKKSSIR